jgi:hypothetical protein
MRFNVMYVNTECYQFSVEAEDKASAREIAENMDIGDHMLEPDWRLQITEGDAPFPNQNEDGEAVPPIYDTEGRLTAISLNCDTLLNKNVQPSRQEQRNLIEGIKHMVQELVESQWKGEPRRG